MTDILTHSTALVVRRRALAGLSAGAFAALAAGRFSVLAQEPAPDPACTRVGAKSFTTQLLGSGDLAAAPGLELTLWRSVLMAGGSVPDHTHPGALVILVETGTLGYTALGGTAQLVRAANESTLDAGDAMPTGTEVLLYPGDWISVDNPRVTVRNAGRDDVVLLSAGLTRVGEPFTAFMTGNDREIGPTPY